MVQLTYNDIEDEIVHHTWLKKELTFLCSFLSTCLSVSCQRASSSCCFLRASATALASAFRALAVAALEFSPWNFFGIPTAVFQLRDKPRQEGQDKTNVSILTHNIEPDFLFWMQHNKKNTFSRHLSTDILFIYRTFTWQAMRRSSFRTLTFIFSWIVGYITHSSCK